MNRPKPILLVEDDDVDAATIEQTLAELRVANPLIRKTDGEEALEYLNSTANPRPGIIFLDLNMPKIDGIELLQIIKVDERLRKIPVVVLTVSRYEQDKVETFNLAVAGYIIKPVDYEEFLASMNTVVEYWEWNNVLVRKMTQPAGR